MYPTYNDGQVVFTTPFDNISSLSCGDVLIIKEAGKYMIKRVEGLPGQELYISDEGVLYRNNEPVDDPYNIKTESSGLLSEKYMIPKDTVFVLGDNRNNSNDSRFYGPISVDNIISIVKN